MLIIGDGAARYHLNRAIMDDGFEFYAAHPWFWEGARWNELLFCVGSQVCAVEEAELRNLIAELADLDLLEVEDLADLPREGDGHVSIDLPAFGALAETMARYGVDADTSRVAVTAFSDAARSLKAGFDGKVQRYLRHYGERMLAELDQHFRFTGLDQEQIRLAFTEWMQNCLSMPLSLRDEATRAYCEERGISVDALFDAADAADVNFAYLDDLTQPVMRTGMPEPEQAEAQRVAEE